MSDEAILKIQVEGDLSASGGGGGGGRGGSGAGEQYGPGALFDEARLQIDRRKQKEGLEKLVEQLSGGPKSLLEEAQDTIKSQARSKQLKELVEQLSGGPKSAMQEAKEVFARQTRQKEIEALVKQMAGKGGLMAQMAPAMQKSGLPGVSGLGGLAASMMASAGPLMAFAAVIGAAVIGLKAFMGWVSKSADALSEYNAGIATAKAQAEVTDISRAMRRGNYLEQELSSYIRAESRMRNATEDLLAEIAKDYLPAIVSLMEKAADFTERVPAGVDRMREDVAVFIGKLVGLGDEVKLEFELQRKAREAEKNGGQNTLDQLLSGLRRPSMEGFAAPRQPIPQQPSHRPFGRGFA